MAKFSNENVRISMVSTKEVKSGKGSKAFKKMKIGSYKE